jgi:hypothetical protein
MSDLGAPPKQTFSDEEASAVLGKRVLVGITYRNLDGKVESLEQFCGVALRVNLREGLVLKLASSDERSIPPDLSRLEVAAPGNYRLKDTGEVVVDPDFTVLWTHYPKGYSGEG